MLKIIIQINLKLRFLIIANFRCFAKLTNDMKTHNSFSGFLANINFRKLVGPAIGLAALLWFLIRVIPKPSRALYPCQRAAFPVAAAFVAWIISSVGLATILRFGYRSMIRKKFLQAGIFVVASLMIVSAAFIFNPLRTAYAGNENSFLEPAPPLKSLVNEQESSVLPVSKVGIVKATKATAESLELEDIRYLVEEAVQIAGGLDDIVSNGDVVVIKPNLVTHQEGSGWTQVPPEVNGITTDWRIVRAVTDLVRQMNPDGMIYVIEGSAQETDFMYDIMNYSKETLPSVDEIYCLEDISGNWRDHDSPELMEVLLPEGKNKYPDNKKPYNSPYYYLNKLYYDADVLISLPLVKNHESASVTGSIKNLSIGATPANIYGREEDNNNRGTIDHGSNIHGFLHDFYMCRPADFAIMDGLQGLEYGPLGITGGSQSYEATKKNMRLILASKDLVALDAIESLLVSYDPSKINYLSYLHNDDLGCADATLIDVAGVRVADERLSFKHTKSTDPKFTDNIPPSFEVQRITVLDDNEMEIKLSGYENIDKIELLFDDEKYSSIFINDFEELSIDISEIQIDNETSLSIVGYNKYLSYSEQNFTDLLTGVHVDESRIPMNKRIKIYPTLVEDFVNLEFPGLVGQLQVLNLNGQIIKTVFLDPTDLAEVYLGNLKQGFYVLNLVKDRSQHYLGKIYKQ